MTPEAPIAVVGGGPAGAACAYALARSGHPVRLLAADGRTSGPAFGETAGPALAHVLANESLVFPERCGCPLPVFRSAWGSDEPTGRSFAFWRAGHGRVLDRPVFDRWLRDEAEHAGAEVVRGGRVVGARRDDAGGWRIDLSVDGTAREIAAGFVVEASGRAARSHFRPAARRIYVDRLVGASARFRLPPSREAEAVVESREAGWWFAARAPDGRALVAWFTDADDALPADLRTRFATAAPATRLVRSCVGRVPRGEVRAYDARTSIRTPLWSGRWLPIGDAAWTLDPLSGSGVERAVRSGFRAAHAISESVRLATEEPLRAFATSQVEAFDAACRDRRAAYLAEGRFRSHPFWRRRTAGESPGPDTFRYLGCDRIL